MELKEYLFSKAGVAFSELASAFNKAEEELINIVKGNGGKINTSSSFGEKPTLYAVVDFSGSEAYQSYELVPIQAIAYDEGQGLMILTNYELDNYQYDSGYLFEYYGGFEGEDAEHFEDCIKDLSYFRDLDDGYTDVKMTIFNILAGLQAYLA